MSQNEVDPTKSTQPEDLTHTDTVSTNLPTETPKGAAAEDAPIGIRVGNDPSNLGDDMPAEGDLIHPSPMNEPLGKVPGM